MLREMDAVFKALADGSRRKLLDQLRQSNGQTLGELCGHLDMTRQAVTKHLLLLEAANLVAVVWRGREKLHYLNADSRDLRALDRQIRTPSTSGAGRSEKGSRRKQKQQTKITLCKNQS